VEGARRTFEEWEQQAIAELDELDFRSGKDAHALRARRVRTLARAFGRELGELIETGLLPEQAVVSSGTQADRPRCPNPAPGKSPSASARSYPSRCGRTTPLIRKRQ
jgi:hypothetical protein